MIYNFKNDTLFFNRYLGLKLFLKIKIENFYLQKQLQSDRFSLGTPFFS